MSILWNVSETKIIERTGYFLMIFLDPGSRSILITLTLLKEKKAKNKKKQTNQPKGVCWSLLVPKPDQLRSAQNSS